MRSLRVLVAILGGGLSLHGQAPWGAIGFSNLGASSPEQKVYIDDWLDPAALAPSGRQFLVALYFAPLSAGESSLAQVGGAVGFLGFSSNPTGPSGLFAGGTRSVATDNWGGPGLFQVKGWEAAYGSTYEEAAGNPAARRGESPVFIAETANPNTSEPVSGLIPNSYAQQPFRGFVIAVPEPATGVLLVAGVVGAVLVIGRKGRGFHKG